MVFLNYQKMGVELDKAFNAHKDKTRKGKEGTCDASAHDVSEIHRKKEWESTIEDS